MQPCPSGNNCRKLTECFIALLASLLALTACTAAPLATTAPPTATVAALSAVTPPATNTLPPTTPTTGSASEDADSATEHADSAVEGENSATVATTPPVTRHSPPATPQATPTAALPTPAAMLTPPATLSADGCPAPAETYRNEAMGFSLAVPVGYRVFKPAFAGEDEYKLFVVNVAERIAPFQATWLNRATPAQLETLIEEEMRRRDDVPLQRIPITVGGIEGIMLSRIPGEIANAPIFLVSADRVYRLLYSAPTSDDLVRCLLAGVSFFTPTLTLEEQFLTQEAEAQAATAEAQAATRAAAPYTLDIDSGLATYHSNVYGFSFSYPSERWTLVERAGNPHRLSLAYHELGIALRIGVARVGEEADLQLYGGRAGEFVPQGEITFLGQPVGRSALVYEGVTWSVHYNDTAPIARGDLLFSLGLISNRTIEQGATIPEAVQAEANRIIETFALDGP